MAFFNWSSTFSVGVKEMDAQHQTMIGIINKLHDAMLAGKAATELGGIIDEMVEYAKFHFAAEIKMLEANNYTGITKQKAEHDGFTRKVLDFQSQFKQGKLALSVEILNFLKEWWTNHVQVEDKKYTEHLKGRGIS